MHPSHMVDALSSDLFAGKPSKHQAAVASRQLANVQHRPKCGGRQDFPSSLLPWSLLCDSSIALDVYLPNSARLPIVYAAIRCGTDTILGYFGALHNSWFDIFTHSYTTKLRCLTPVRSGEHRKRPETKYPLQIARQTFPVPPSNPIRAILQLLATQELPP